MNDLYKIINSKSFVFNDYIVKYIDKNMTLNEFLILVYFINSVDSSFDVEHICSLFNISLEDAMTSFNSLINKGLVSIDNDKDLEGRIMEKVSLDGLYKLVSTNLLNDKKEKDKISVFDVIEKEFERKLTPIECEIINGWFDIGTSEEIILGAVKEASFNGVKSLRYIDKIIYEWTKKGFKNMDDVNSHMKQKEQSREDNELFDYDWLDDDE